MTAVDIIGVRTLYSPTLAFVTLCITCGLVFALYALLPKHKRRLLPLVCRLLALLFVALALSQPYLEKKGATRPMPLLLDVSDSLDEQLAQEALTLARERIGETLEVHPFASTVGELIPSSTQAYRRIKDQSNALNIGESNLEQALRRALEFNTDSIAFVSDGQETQGDLESILPLLQQAGKKIFPFLPKNFSSSEKTARISALHTPLIASKNEAISASVSIANSFPKAIEGVLEVYQSGKLLEKRTVQLPASEEQRIPLSLNAVTDGLEEIETRFYSNDETIPKSSARSFIAGEKQDKILLLSADNSSNTYLEAALKNQAYQVETIAAKRFEAKLFDKISDYSVLIFNNIALQALPKNAAQQVKEYVAQGGGFIMIGGNNSFGLGGYLGTSIADILPVEILPPQKEEKRLNIAVQLVLDKSGSMKERQKIDFSKAAAVSVVQSLKPEDYLGIVGFDSTPFELLPMARVGVNREKAEKRIQLMFPGTTTNLLPALELSRRRLEAAQAGRKHMIILTDGKIPDGPTRRPYYLQVVDEMRRTGITVSTFMIGSEQDVILKEIAQTGGGAFHRTSNAMSLPRLFLEDIKVSTGERTQKESSKFDVRKGDSPIVSTSLSAFPVLRGYVQTKRRKNANLELVAYANRKAEPLLASWNYKKGQVIAYTSDVTGRWSYYWVGWPRFTQFWSDLVKAATQGEANATDTLDFDMNYFVKGENLYIDTSIYSAEIAATLSLRVKSPNGTEQAFTLRQLALGHYRALIPNAQAGTYTATLYVGETPQSEVAFLLSGEYFSEQKGKGFNSAVLSRLASMSGGVLNPNKEQLATTGNLTVVTQSLQALCIGFALLCLLLEILTRHVALPRLWSKKSPQN